MRTDITLYTPAGDGVRENSHTITYKGIKDFTVNDNLTVTFKTHKGVEINTPLMWRTKKGDEAVLDEAAAEPAAAPARAGNAGRWGR